VTRTVYDLPVPAFDSPAGWVEGEDVRIRTELAYRHDEPVEVVVRKRGWRYDISDGAHAVDAAGRPHGWREVAQRVVDDHALNLNRRGVVFVQANEARLVALVARVAACSRAVYEELLEQG
jgi:hypothetical protein